jgi:hypothetical protein
MKKIIISVLLIFCLNSCTTSPNTSIQKTLIKDGSIKVGMNLQPLMSMLASAGESMLYSPLYNSDKSKLLFMPKAFSSYDTKYYAAEPIDPNNKKLSCPLTCYWGVKLEAFKVTHVFDDKVEAWEHYIKLATNNKEKMWLLKQKANTLKNTAYINWKNKKSKKIVKANPKTKKPKAENSTQIQASSGTAFFIDNKGHLITNYHVVEGCNNKSKINYKGKDININLKAKDRYLDLALLKADVNNDQYISFANNNPKKLERIIVAGYPFGKALSDDLKFTSGIITSLKGFMDDSTRLQIDAAINPGNSGGPIVYEKNGQLAGVAVSGLRKDKTEGMNFGIKTSSVQNFLVSNQINLSSMPQKFNFNNDDLANLLENSTIYTYCK